MGHEPRTVLGSLQTVVKRFAVPLVIRNLLATKVGNAKIVVVARTSAFEIDPLQTSKGSGGMAGEAIINETKGEKVALRLVNIAGCFKGIF